MSSKKIKILLTIIVLIDNLFQISTNLNSNNNNFNINSEKDNNNINNTDIYMTAFKDFPCPVLNKVYKILLDDASSLKNSYPLEIIDCKNSKNKLTPLSFSYSEINKYYYIYKKVPLKKYIGFVQYRRFFKFLDDVPDMDEVFKKYDAVLPTPLELGKTVRQHYINCHNIDDLNDVGSVIKKYFSDYYKDFLYVTNEQKFIRTNSMFIMKKNDFLLFCDFLFGVLDKYNELRGFTKDEDVYKYVAKNIVKYRKEFGDFLDGDSIKYQSRIHGFLSERIGNIFYHHQFKNVLNFDIKETKSSSYNFREERKKERYYLMKIHFFIYSKELSIICGSVFAITILISIICYCLINRKKNKKSRKYVDIDELNNSKINNSGVISF